MVNKKNRSNNEGLIQGAENAIEQMKYEIAKESGIQLGPDTISRANRSVGGEITKRLAAMAGQQLGGRFTH
ncbi:MULTISPECIES: alpha/beta-type small acid-soluble spore protein [Bacillus cereus group]|uniref:alpha/beta-type small acid-soluble spore protein n=1 Tax=Bacillus cereus group TaxID=86661 RepID=UPI000BFCC525|nr:MULTISPECIES: alpha/beta-type small acid-soluble spore protein [Bacillus cereus group]PGQ44535.1 spore protein [Bacillus thuringiensis]PGV69851.1 spore protein [Bacillus cereus]